MSLRRTTLPVILAIMCIHSALSSNAAAQSIWSRRTNNHAFLFYDTRARNVGDLVTVVISQGTDVGSRENRAMDQETETSGFFGFNFSTGGGLGTQAADASGDLTAATDRNFDGNSNYRSAQNFTDRVSATVVDVMPNGNLVLSGHREMLIAGETRTLTISGVIRSNDLGPDNVVHSRYISDFNIFYDGLGPSQAFTRQGWLGRKINRYWPF